jgi:plastocyanin
MSHAADDRARPNPVWLLVVVVMVGLALAGPVIMVRDQLADAPAAAPTAAEGAQPAEGAAAEAAAGGTVKMAGLAFAPQGLSVARGATVVFDNDDTAPHTVTARSGGVDSGVLDPGKQFSLVVTDGFDYFCSIHPSMTAKIAVTG